MSTAVQTHPDTAAFRASMDFQAPPAPVHEVDTDALSCVCPECGAAAEWPDCESCGYLFDKADEVHADTATPR